MSNLKASHLSPALEGPLAMIKEWLNKIVAAENPELDLRNLRSLLVNILNTVEDDREISAAVDGLSAAAAAYLETRSAKANARQTTRLKQRRAQINEAFATLRAALERARPSPRAQDSLW
jgi:hypothetical protein